MATLRVSIGALTVLAVTYIVNAMDRGVFPVLLGDVDAQYRFSLATGGLLATIFTFGLGIGGLPAGYLFKRWSRKTVAVSGIIIYSGCTILTCWAVGFLDMAFYRIVSGVGEAFQNVAIFTIAGAWFVNDRTLAFGVLNLAYALGSFIGPRWAAHMLAAYGSWQLPLTIYGILGLLGAVLFILLVPRNFSEAQPEARDPNPGRKTDIPEGLINRNTALLTFASMAGGLAAYGYLALYPTYLRTELHFSIEDAGAAASMYGVGAAAHRLRLHGGSHQPEMDHYRCPVGARRHLLSHLQCRHEPRSPKAAVGGPGCGIQRLPVRQQLLADAALGADTADRPGIGTDACGREHSGGRFRLRDGEIGRLARMEHGIRSADDAADRGRGRGNAVSPRQTDRPRRGGFFGIADKPVARSLTS